MSRPVSQRPAVPSRRAVLVGAAALPLVGMPAVLRAQTWKPAQAVRIVVPAAAGGTTDIMARLLGAHLQQRWGQSVVVDNKAGGGGTIGTMEVLRAPADGHTMLMGNIGPQAIGYSLFRGLQYTPASFAPVSCVITGPNVLVVHPSVPARTVPEFVAWLKAQDGKASYASSGTGQSPHLSGAWFLQLTGTKATHIPYRGAAPALADLIAGVTHCFFDNLTTAIEHIRSGKLRGIAVTSAKRSPHIDLPTIAETMPELKDYDVSTWFGVFYAAGAPRAAVEEVNAQIKALLDLPATKERFAQMAGDAAWSPPEQFSAFVDAEIKKWGGVIEREGLKLDIN